MRASVTVAGEKILLDELADLKTKTGRKVTRVVLQSALKVIAKQMQRDLDPKVKEAGKAVGTKVTIYRQNITRAKVGFNVGKNARRVPFTRKRTSKGGVGIGPMNVHWYIAGTESRWRYGYKGPQQVGKITRNLSRRQRRSVSVLRGEQGRRSTGTMPAQQPGLAANAARKSVSEMRAVMSRAGRRYLEAVAATTAKKMARAKQAQSQQRLLTATGKG
jgi:hypothetical protein